jgi:CheY-like chemotaxis protein
MTDHPSQKPREFSSLLGGAFLFSLTPSSSGRTIRPIVLPFGRWSMYRPPPLRGQPVLEGKTVLLIDPNQPTRDVRVRVLQNHGVEVHATADLSGARFLWQPHVYDLILLDVRRHLPGEALEFYEQIRAASPSEHFAFLVGPPVYLSRTWLGEVTEFEASQGQWEASVRRFLTAA